MGHEFFLEKENRNAIVESVLFAVAILVVLGFVGMTIVIAVTADGQPLATWLQGATQTNHVRNLLELVYFIANIILLVVAAWALRFASRQAREARHARIANVYMQITERWNSHALVESRMYILALRDEYLAQQGLKLEDLENMNGVADHVKKSLIDLQAQYRVRHRRLTLILIFLEELGVLCGKDYVHEEDIFEYMAPPLVHQMELLASYIQHARASNEEIYENALTIYERARKFQEEKNKLRENKKREKKKAADAA